MIPSWWKTLRWWRCDGAGGEVERRSKEGFQSPDPWKCKDTTFAQLSASQQQEGAPDVLFTVYCTVYTVCYF